MLSVLPGARSAGSTEPLLIGKMDSCTGMRAAQGLAPAEGVRTAIDAANAGRQGNRPLGSGPVLLALPERRTLLDLGREA
jgi:hypothetical protein